MTNKIEKLNAYLQQHNFHHHAYASWADDDTFCEIEITWGDWKHDHLRCKWLVEEFAEANGLRCIHAVHTTEEDGGDAYSAIHKIALVG